jgi:hypothetical protein
MSAIENLSQLRNSSNDNIVFTKEMFEQEDAVTIYSDFLTDKDSPAKIPNFEAKAHYK